MSLLEIRKSSEKPSVLYDSEFIMGCPSPPKSTPNEERAPPSSVFDRINSAN